MTTRPRIRALIAEDEPRARSLLRSLLETHAEIEIIGEVGDGVAAVAAIEADRPDLVFLDVKMPELDGLGVIERVGAARMPVVVFVTAFEAYAVKAFDLHAVDYLLKPFDAERVARAVRRAVDRFHQGKPDELTKKYGDLLEKLARRNAAPERFPIRSDGRVRFVEVADIDWVEARDHHVVLHVGKEAHVVRDSMTKVEQRLGSEAFVRVHRSIIANKSRIVEVQPWFQGDFVVILRDGTRLTTGPSYRNAVRRLLA